MALNTELKKLFFLSAFRNSKAVSVGIVVVVLIVGGLWVLYPKYDSIRKKGLLTYDSKKLELQQRTEYLKKIDSMLEQYRTVQPSDVALANLILPDEQQIPELFVMLDQLGRDLGVKVSRIAFSIQPAAAPVAGQAVSAKTAGQVERLGITLGIDFTESVSYGKYKEILKGIEQNIRILDLNNASFDASQKSMTLNLSTYYLETN